MLVLSGMSVKHLGMSLSMYFSKLWRLQELNFWGMMELHGEGRRVYVRVGAGKEKQYSLQEKFNIECHHLYIYILISTVATSYGERKVETSR